ncbi:MAG: PLP-dependent transferase [Planctomycetes bacterium]|nr:PLP-dependent transferase [Planctomycetota bacterium]
MSDAPRDPRLHPETTSITEGFDPRLSVMAVRPPIYPVSTFAFRSAEESAHWFDVALGRVAAVPGETASLIYARLNNPNAEMFEDALHAVEKSCAAAAAFSSGMAAITTTLLALLRPGDRLVYCRPVYGGTDWVFRHMLPEWQIETIATEGDEPVHWQSAISRAGERLAAVYVETPANPTLRMTDLKAVIAATRAAQRQRPIPVMVDNTFLGPVFQSPLALGADLALYSATKFLGGHSDLVAGAVTARDPEPITKVKTLRAFLGTICEPFTAWLLQRSMATLHLRMIKQSKNAAKIVEVIKAHPAVAAVHHPTLLSGDQARIYHEQCTAPGSLVSIDVRGGRTGAFRFLNALKLVRLAVSLGGVESLACHPRSTTASEMSAEDLAASGITEGLVRLSIGVEYWRDIAADLTQALDRSAMA